MKDEKSKRSAVWRKLIKLKKRPCQFIADSVGVRVAKQIADEGAHRSSKLFLSLHYSIWLVTPISLVFIYLFFIATPKFESTATVVVKKSDEPNITAGASMSLLGIDTGQGQDAYLVQHYILSQDMLNFLERKLALRQHYSSSDADWLSALATDASAEDFADYYLNNVTVEFDDVSGLITIAVKSFNADYSQKIIQTMVKQAELFINDLGHKMAQDEVLFVETELDRAHKKLVNLTEQMTTFQNEKKVFSTEQQSAAVLASVAELNSLLISKQTELEALLSYMNKDAAEVVTLKSQITALTNQINTQKKKLINAEQPALNQLNIEFKNLSMQIEFATDVYKAALLGLEQTRVEAHRKLKHLLVVAKPTLADEALYPRRIYWFTTISILLIVIYSVVVMLIATVKEHKED